MSALAVALIACLSVALVCALWGWGSCHVGRRYDDMTAEEFRKADTPEDWRKKRDPRQQERRG